MKNIVHYAFKLGLCLLLVFTFIPNVNATALINHIAIKTDTVEAFIPQIKDKQYKNKNVANLNKTLKNEILNAIDGFKELHKEAKHFEDSEQYKYFTFYSNYTVKFNKRDLLSITNEGYQYTGGAHGLNWRGSITTNLKTGKVYKLYDLFKEDSNFIEIINKEIRKQIASNESWSRDITFESVSEDSSFYLTEKGITIYYNIYEIAPYSLGRIEFDLSNNEVLELLKDEIKNNIALI